MSRWPKHTSFSSIQCWKARFVRTPCELALLRFVDNIEWVGAGGRLKYVFLPQQYDNDCNHCHKSLAHTHPFPTQCWKAQFVRTPCELALLRFVDNIEWVGVGGRLKEVFVCQQYGNDCMHVNKGVLETF